MTRARRVDGNQPDIVDKLRAFGASVHVGSALGSGFPDLVVGYRGRVFLFEVKDPTKPLRDQQLTPDQVRWHSEWRGHAAVIRSAEEAIAEIERQITLWKVWP